MKKAAILVSLGAIFIVSCAINDLGYDNDQSPTGVRSKNVVDKIYDYHNNLLAEYIYDSDNKLTKRKVADIIVESYRVIERKWEDEFEYKNGRVSKIKSYSRYIDSYFGDDIENHSETTFEYDSQGKLIKKNGESLNFRYEKGRVVGSLNKNDQWIISDTMVYDNSENIIEHIRIVPELTDYGEPIPGTSKRTVRYYEYDNMPKPNFGLDYLFVYNPLPYIEVPDLIRTLSNNNMTKAIEDGYTFVYTYNENGLPNTIETKWIGIETSEPMLLRITYKQIE